MAKVTVGDVEYDVSLPNFKALKAAWVHIRVFQGADLADVDPMAAIDAMLGLISVGSKVPVSVETLEEQLRPDQMVSVSSFVNALLVESGLAAKPAGEGDPQGDTDPSRATSTPSSES